MGVDALLVRIAEGLARGDLVVANWYRNRGDTQSEMFLLQRVLQDHGNTQAAQEAKDRLEAYGAPMSVPALPKITPSTPSELEDLLGDV